MKLGMSLLLCEHSYGFIPSIFQYHAQIVDEFAYVVNNPSDKLLYVLAEAAKRVGKPVHFLGEVNGPMTYDLQSQTCTEMTRFLARRRCDWVIPGDDDEFYVGDVLKGITDADGLGCNVLYTDGYLFHGAVGDRVDPNPVKSMVWRDPDKTVYATRKAIHKTVNFSYLTPGNHWAIFNDGRYIHHADPDILIYHYGDRVRQMFQEAADRPTYQPLTGAQIAERGLVNDTTLYDLFNEQKVP